MNKPLTHPDVHFPPPVLFAVLIALGWGLQALIALPNFTVPFHGLLGGEFIVVGLGIIVWSATEFKRHKTTILPHKASSTIINSGPFKYSRNPIYFAFSMIQLGAAVLLANLWILLLLIPAFLIMTKFVIEREEAFLTQEFGQPYIDYKNQVRRWI
ncbi:MAG: isoprenylcysteine carboxylmethyltransferase family protein [Pseudomonadales bacterium]|nr:isoprenylcysteine carboxylmethyltransferase family protein [Pseudomonadales bacterium]